MELLIPILAVTVIGLLAAIMLVAASKFMSVPVDETFTKVRECLPGANCGACGYAGCDGYAQALSQGGVAPNLCVPGGQNAAAGIAAYVEEKRERLVGVVELGEGETLDEAMLTTDLRGKPFRLGHMYLYAHLVFDTDAPSFNIRIRSDAGVRYFVYHQFKDAASVKEMDLFLEAHTSSVLTQSRFVYGTAAQGLDAAEQKITLCNTVQTGIQDVRLSLSEDSGAVRIPLLAGSRIVVTGTDWCEG